MDQNNYIFDGYRPGALARMLTLHMDYYGVEWGFGRQFETYCAGGMAAFFEKYNESRDYFQAAWTEKGEMMGCIVIDGGSPAGKRAQLRWFIVNPLAHGRGVGGKLLDGALSFCRERNVEQVRLATFAGLEASRKLYEKAGFVLVEEKPNDPWTGDKGELIFEWKKNR